MRKILAIILSCTVLLQSLNFEVNDILKIPNLVQHFKLHMDSGDSISEFISLHYGYKYASHKNKDKEHQKLPFQGDLNSIYNINFLDFTNEIANISIEFSTENKNFIYVESFVNLLPHTIFQPPKIA